MACLPLIERELRVALRKQRPVEGRLKVAALATAATAGFVFLGTRAGDPRPGRTLEQILCLGGLYCVFRTPQLTAGVLAQERRNETLGLLFLSGLSVGEVFISKFFSSALVAFTDLLAIFPLLAIPFLMGGVSFNLFLAIVSALPILMLFVVAISLLGSVLTREEDTALVTSIALGVLICFLTPAIYIAHAQFSLGRSPSQWWWRLSPAYGPRLVWFGFGSGFGPAERAEFWRNAAVTIGWSALALAAAAFGLKRIWHTQIAPTPTRGWFRYWQALLHGSPARRQDLARTWLQVNPFVWVAARDRQPAALGWLSVVGLLLAWLLGCAAWPARGASVPSFLLAAILFNCILAWLTRQAAAQQIGLARRDGAYEILLTTSLSPSEIVWGQIEALRVHFRPLTYFVLLLEIAMMLIGLCLRDWQPASLVVYFGSWILLWAWTWSLGHRWVHVIPSMLASLNCARPAQAVWRTRAFRGWGWFWILFNLRFLTRGVWLFPTASIPELILISTGAFAVVLFFLIQSVSENHGARIQDIAWNPQTKTWLVTRRPASWGPTTIYERRLIQEFREIVREPIPDPHDPRFKKWNLLDRFPWGPEFSWRQFRERIKRS